MYSTCLFCHTNLGANEEVEHFPIGRRLAFDSAKGRLWVVCRKCERWNLTPVEERWEAIEECERSFRATKLRVSTDEIGMGRLKEGLELVRIGKPLRPEFAAWRYGDQFGRRRRNKIFKGTAVMGALIASPLIGPALGLSLAGGGYYLADGLRLAFQMYENVRVIARVRTEDGKVLPVRGSEVDETVLLPPRRDRPWGLRITHRGNPDPSERWWQYAGNDAQTDIHGDAAIKVAGQLLPRLNQAGASRRQLEEAVALVSKNPDPAIAFDRTARIARRAWVEYGKGAMLTLVPTEVLLSLEMASHEDSERRALEGELSVLADAWREAEEIAAISDDMFLPTTVSRSLVELKNRAFHR
ncbi:MAG: hypothetical protein ACREMS_05000 [Gemmatimonadaceae bacterium]